MELWAFGCDAKKEILTWCFSRLKILIKVYYEAFQIGGRPIQQEKMKNNGTEQKGRFYYFVTTDRKTLFWGARTMLS